MIIGPCTCNCHTFFLRALTQRVRDILSTTVVEAGFRSRLKTALQVLNYGSCFSIHSRRAGLRSRAGRKASSHARGRILMMERRA